MVKIKEKPAKKVWENFEKEFGLDGHQIEMFKKYASILTEWNKSVNLTAISDLSGIVRQHFMDSLILKDFENLNQINSIADVGTGAGFPSIPLKIIFQHLDVFLIEVNKKKQKFLRAVVEVLELENVEIVDIDWRTFLKKTNYNIDLFLTRAALQDLELVRMFRPTGFYKDSTLIYWASKDWKSHPKAEKFIRTIKKYKLGKKERKLIFYGLHSN